MKNVNTDGILLLQNDFGRTLYHDFVGYVSTDNYSFTASCNIGFEGEIAALAVIHAFTAIPEPREYK